MPQVYSRELCSNVVSVDGEGVSAVGFEGKVRNWKSLMKDAADRLASDRTGYSSMTVTFGQVGGLTADVNDTLAMKALHLYVEERVQLEKDFKGMGTAMLVDLRPRYVVMMNKV